MVFHLRYFSDNFHELATYDVDSKIVCGSMCALETDYHICTAFSFDDGGQICHCGKIIPFLVGPFGEDRIHIGIDCKATVNVSGLSLLPWFFLPLVHLEQELHTHIGIQGVK